MLGGGQGLRERGKAELAGCLEKANLCHRSSHWNLVAARRTPARPCSAQPLERPAGAAWIKEHQVLLAPKSESACGFQGAMAAAIR